MTRFWRESPWMCAFVLVAACSGQSADLFEDDGSGGDGSGDTGGSSDAGAGESSAGEGSDDGTGGIGAVNTGGAAIGGVSSPAGGVVGAGGTFAGGAVGVGGVFLRGGSIGAGGVAFPGGFGGAGGTFAGSFGGGGRFSGGSSGAGGTGECSDPDAADYKKRGTSKGNNGSFEDRCEDGNLVEYVCETAFRPCPAMTSGADSAAAPALPIPIAGGGGIAPPSACMYNTGRVVETRISCGGRCDEGTCFGWCPATGDELSYEDVSGAEVVLHNPRTEASYRCEVVSSTGDAECTDPALEGETRSVATLMSCSAAVISFAARLSDDATCNYRCSLVD